MTSGAQEFAARAVQAQRQVGGRAGQHGQIGFARRVVHHRAVRAPVDLQAQAADLHGQPVHAHQAGAAYFGLQAGPAARHIARGHLGGTKRLAHDGQGQIDLAHAQTDRVGLPAVDTRKGLQRAGAYEQHVHRHRDARLVDAARGCHIGQRDAAAFFLNAKGTSGLHKTEHVQRQLASGP